MNPVVVALALLGLVAVATVVGLLWKRSYGHLRETDDGEKIALGEITDASAGEQATLLQFSTEVCAPCRTTHEILQSLAGELTGVEHVDVDVTHRADIANRFNLLQSPTTLILDSRGVVRARIGGAPRPIELRAELDRILNAA